MGTIRNRSVPPLRPGVVDLLAAEFPHTEFVSNGGLASLADVEDRLARGSIGAMVGRAAINHPCSFAGADALWHDRGAPPALPSRGDVLREYVAYCAEEERRVAVFATPRALMALRRRLVAVPFHLFVGEEGNDRYQRRIRKLVARAHRHSAAAVLGAARREVPDASLARSVGEYTPAGELPVFRFVERSGPLQKSIY